MYMKDALGLEAYCTSQHHWDVLNIYIGHIKIFERLDLGLDAIF